MNRGFWFAAGAATGVYGLVKVRRTVEKFTPDGVGARVAALRTGARMFATEVQAGMSERETELLQELRARAVHPPAIEAPRAAPAPGDDMKAVTTAGTNQEGVTDGHR